MSKYFTPIYLMSSGLFRNGVILLVATAWLLSPNYVEAKNCKKGIRCGQTCIASWLTCHVDAPNSKDTTNDAKVAVGRNTDKIHSLGTLGLGSANAVAPQADLNIETPESSVSLQSEADYVFLYCTQWRGRPEAQLNDLTKVDCLTSTQAIEFDFAHKWAEAIGQALHYGRKTNRTATIALIMRKPGDVKYYRHIAEIRAKYKLPIKVIQIVDFEQE